MFYLPESKKRYYRYIGLLAVVVLGVVSILGTGGGGDSAPPPPTGPSVVVFPAQSSDTALVTTEVLARFSETMDPLTIDNNSFLLLDSVSNPITGSIDYYTQYDGHDNVAVFIPTSDLDIGEEYFATLTTDITSTSGIPLARDYNWSFNISPAIVPVSTDETGAVGTNYDGASDSAVDATGEYIVFVSKEILAGQSTNSKAQIYRKNTITGKIDIVSLSDSGQLANADCSSPRINDTGRFVVFASYANNLDLSFTDQSKSHIYLKDMKSGITDTINLLDVNKDDSTKPANGSSSMPDISSIPDTGSGKYVVFQSNAPDLHANDTDTINDIFLINIASRTVELVSVDSAEIKGNGASTTPRVSENGNLVVFESIADNLATSDPNTTADIFLRNVSAGTTSHISISSTGGAANGASNNADISADGDFVVFQSDASNMLPAGIDSNGATDIFLRDIGAPSTIRMSVDSAGSQVTGASSLPSISGDGQYVAFESLSTQLVTADTNGVTDVFARDKDAASTITRLSVNNLGVQGNNPSSNAAISADGRYVSFTTQWAFDNVIDKNGVNDIYRAYNDSLP